MDLLSAAQAYGHRIALRTSDPRHIAAGKLATPGNGLLESRATSAATPAEQAKAASAACSAGLGRSTSSSCGPRPVPGLITDRSRWTSTT
jgi:hypothetical protein